MNENIKKHLDYFLSRDKKFRYMMLSRLQSDCEYYLGYGNRYAGSLWAHDEKAQIFLMRGLYNSFEVKPVWCTAADIDRYEAEMCDLCGRMNVLNQ